MSSPTVDQPPSHRALLRARPAPLAAPGTGRFVNATRSRRAADVAARAEAERRAVREYLDTKGELRAPEAVVCLARWLEAARGPGPISTRDVQRLYPRYGPESAVAPLRSAADALSSAAGKGMFTPVARLAGGPRASFYTLTDLGRAVAAALPDQHAVRAIRGLKGAAPRRRSRS